MHCTHASEKLHAAMHVVYLKTLFTRRNFTVRDWSYDATIRHYNARCYTAKLQYLITLL